MKIQLQNEKGKKIKFISLKEAKKLKAKGKIVPVSKNPPVMKLVKGQKWAILDRKKAIAAVCIGLAVLLGCGAFFGISKHRENAAVDTQTTAPTEYTIPSTEPTEATEETKKKKKDKTETVTQSSAETAGTVSTTANATVTQPKTKSATQTKTTSKSSTKQTTRATTKRSTTKPTAGKTPTKPAPTHDPEEQETVDIGGTVKNNTEPTGSAQEMSE